MNETGKTSFYRNAGIRKHLDAFNLTNIPFLVYDPVIGYFTTPHPSGYWDEACDIGGASDPGYNLIDYSIELPEVTNPPVAYTVDLPTLVIRGNGNGKIYSIGHDMDKQDDGDVKSKKDKSSGGQNSGSSGMGYTLAFFNDINSYSGPDDFVHSPSYYNYYEINTNYSYTTSPDPVQNVDATEAMYMAKGEKVGGGTDLMDYANKIVSSVGTIVGGAQYTVGAVKNQSLWSASYKMSKTLKSIGINVQTRVIKHGAKTLLANASRKITIVGGVLSVGDVFIDGQINASHLLNAGMVGISAIPIAGWIIIGGAYFAADIITLGVTGQSIGEHLDDAVGSPLVKDIYDW